MSARPSTFAFLCGAPSLLLTHYYELLCELVQGGVEVHVCVDDSAPDSLVETLEKRSMLVRKMPLAGGRGRRALALPMVVAWLVDNEVQLVHSLSDETHRLAGWAAKAASVPHVVASASTVPPLRKLATPAPIRGLVEGRLNLDVSMERIEAKASQLRRGNVDAWILMNRGDFEAARNLGWDESEVTLLAGGIGARVDAIVSEDERPVVQLQARKRIGLEDASAIVATIVETGSVEEIEALDRLLEDAEKALRYVRHVVVIRSELHRELRTGREVVVLQGAEHVADVLNAADLLLQPWCPKGQALAVQEAGAARLPALVVDGNAHREVLRPGQNGEIVELAALASRGRELLDEPMVRHMMGSHARSYALRVFDRDLAIQRIFSIYESVLTGEEREIAQVTSQGEVVRAPADPRRLADLLGDS